MAKAALSSPRGLIFGGRLKRNLCTRPARRTSAPGRLAPSVAPPSRPGPSGRSRPSEHPWRRLRRTLRNSPRRKGVTSVDDALPRSFCEAQEAVQSALVIVPFPEAIGRQLLAPHRPVAPLALCPPTGVTRPCRPRPDVSEFGALRKFKPAARASLHRTAEMIEMCINYLI